MTFSAAAGDGGVTLNWTASPDAVAGYHIYRGPGANGPFSRLTDSPVAGTSFVDTNAPPGRYVYMVRATKLEIVPSGSYFNLSDGIFAGVTVEEIRVGASLTLNGIVLGWNSLPGGVYRVQAADDLNPPNWVDVSGGILSTNPLTSWKWNRSGPCKWTILR